MLALRLFVLLQCSLLVLAGVCLIPQPVKRQRSLEDVIKNPWKLSPRQVGQQPCHHEHLHPVGVPVGAEVQRDVWYVQFWLNLLVDGRILGVSAIVALELFLILEIGLSQL